MIQMQTKLNIADNSGGVRAMCIKVLGGSKRRYANIGDVIKVSIKEASPRGKVKKVMFMMQWSFELLKVFVVKMALVFVLILMQLFFLIQN